MKMHVLRIAAAAALACSIPASPAQGTTGAPAPAAPAFRSETMCGFFRPPPETIHSFGLSGRCATDRRIASAETAASVRAPSASSRPDTCPSVKSLRSSDFGPPLAKNGLAR